MILNIITYVVIGIGLLAMLGCFIALIKNECTFNNRIMILNAIHTYNLEKILQHFYDEVLNPDLMEDYDDTFKRIFDWGYKNILPPEQFELIKPYIKTGKKKEKNS